MALRELSRGLAIQGFAPALALKEFKLVAFGMDSTLIDIECVDEIADAVGMKAEVAANRAQVFLAEAQVPLAMAEAFREGNLERLSRNGNT